MRLPAIWFQFKMKKRVKVRYLRACGTSSSAAMRLASASGLRSFNQEVAPGVIEFITVDTDSDSETTRWNAELRQTLLKLACDREPVGMNGCQPVFGTEYLEIAGNDAAI